MPKNHYFFTVKSSILNINGDVYYQEHDFNQSSWLMTNSYMCQIKIEWQLFIYCRSVDNKYVSFKKQYNILWNSKLASCSFWCWNWLKMPIFIEFKKQ